MIYKYVYCPYLYIYIYIDVTLNTTLTCRTLTHFNTCTTFITLVYTNNMSYAVDVTCCKKFQQAISQDSLPNVYVSNSFHRTLN